jgi:hypothetical protein
MCPIKRKLTTLTPPREALLVLLCTMMARA